jgi:RimJ/RimL family protein N-acetyltransferase
VTPRDAVPVLELPAVGAQLRPWRMDDAASLVRHASNRKVWINLRDTFPHPYTPADARQWLDRVTVLRPVTHFAIAVGGEAVGGIGYERQADVLRRSAEIGFWLGEPWWGRGIATAALAAVSAHAFAAADLIRLYAYVFEWNPASARVLEKAGYVREACLRRAVVKDGRTIDQYLYALVRE